MAKKAQRNNSQIGTRILFTSSSHFDSSVAPVSVDSAGGPQNHNRLAVKCNQFPLTSSTGSMSGSPVRPSSDSAAFCRVCFTFIVTLTCVIECIECIILRLFFQSKVSPILHSVARGSNRLNTPLSFGLQLFGSILKGNRSPA